MSAWEGSAAQQAAAQQAMQQAHQRGFYEQQRPPAPKSAVEELQARASALRLRLASLEKDRAELETIERMLAAVEAK